MGIVTGWVDEAAGTGGAGIVLSRVDVTGSDCITDGVDAAVVVDANCLGDGGFAGITVAC